LREPLFKRVRTSSATIARLSRMSAFVGIATMITACGGSGMAMGSHLIPSQAGLTPQRDRVDHDPPTAAPTPHASATPEDHPDKPDRGRDIDRDRVDRDPPSPSPTPRASVSPTPRVSVSPTPHASASPDPDKHNGGHDPIDHDR
jgi:hypothetical protein